MPVSNMSDSEILTKCAAVTEAFTTEKYAYLLTLFPTPESFSERYERMEANYPAALKGDPEKLKAFEADRKAIHTDLTLLFGLAKLLTVKDATVPESLALGQAHEKMAVAAPSLTSPQGFKVSFDPQGHLFASIAKVAGAKGYQVWICDSDPSVEANWKLAASSTNCRRIAITGINRAKFNVLRIRAMRGTGTGPWSNWVSLEPTI